MIAQPPQTTGLAIVDQHGVPQEWRYRCQTCDAITVLPIGVAPTYCGNRDCPTRKPQPKALPDDPAEAVQLMRALLECFNVDLSDPNFERTPERFVRYLRDHFEPYKPMPTASTFPSTYRGMVIERDISVHGACPHHILPVAYNITVGYLVEESVIGLSKLVRIAQGRARYPSLQEDITEQIADDVQSLVKAKGIGVIVSGRHSCMSIRGVLTSPVVTTSTVRGMFQTLAVRDEFLQLVHRAEG